ncbi:hypothetical protein HCC61_22105 [Streptomyces sp. HNM0575]|uniref:HtaA domain-containing protein n=1 Tax=Streptomyces sp. HNM0575 TaxID=2716338 RepID=UPI00145E975A|nr:HtaA domain-containing protein [Streptomyces sp. HNM0575]NLU75328.1 hypothetical protein [Streptomyces sp. HNM0575]
MSANPPSPRSRSRGRAIALVAATATVLSTAAFALPAHAATGARSNTLAGARPAPAAPVPLTDGTLDWGIKKSFRDYITGPIANGRITVADGAETNEDGTFRFTEGEGTYDTGGHAVCAAFHGSVHLYGHQGALDIELSDFKVTTEGKGGFLSADVATGTGADGTDEPEDVEQDVDLAALDLTDVEPGTGEDGATTFADVPATLTADGAKAFAGYYKEGEKLDPATLNVRTGSGGSGGSGGGGTAGGSAGTAGSGSTAGSGNTGSTAGGPGGSPEGDGTSSSGGSAAGSSTAGSRSGTIVDGNLDWGVKKSFREYVTGPIAHGKVVLSDGARSTDGGYRFPDGSGKAESGSLNASFKGGVRFLGHEEDGSYSLDLTFSGLRVKADGTKGTLISDVRSKDRESGKVTTHKALSVASLKLDAGALDPVKDVVTVKKAPATLTTEGAEAFGGFYEAGDALDPVTAAVSLDENASLPGAGSGDGPGSSSGTGGGDGASAGGAGSVGGAGGSGALASTGSSLPSGPLLGGAALLAALGAGAVCAAHRRTRSTPGTTHGS